MAGDFSRALFDREKHYAGVLMQQGRVHLDADWNEQLAINLHRTSTQTNDVVGKCGTPKSEEGFQITPGPSGDDLLIGPGRYYIGGLLCELNPGPLLLTFLSGSVKQVLVPNLTLDGRPLLPGQWLDITAEQKPAPTLVRILGIDTGSLTLTLDTDISPYQNAGKAFVRRAVTYATQPDLAQAEFLVKSSPPASPPTSGVSLADGTYVVFLEAWQREVNALEDPRIREIALGGPDTTERLQTVWRVQLLLADNLMSPPDSPLHSPPSSPPSWATSPPSGTPPKSDCRTDFPAWQKLIAPMTGMMSARTAPPDDSTNPCLLPPSAGYQRLENQLYRVEVFQGGATLAQTSFVWSRENASVESSILEIDGADVYLHDLGKDDVLGFAAGDWVEIVDREADIQGAARFLGQIAGPPDPNKIKITLGTTAVGYEGRSGLTLRRWDNSGVSTTAAGIPLSSGWLDLEGGIQVRFEQGSYKTGCYWLIPARTATGEIEWAPYEANTQNSIPQPPMGGHHHYCQLAVLHVVAGVWAVQDCRKRFPSLTEICADDVCYDSKCDMPGVSTVQDALDQLCQANDLRFHNKHLHGWGIVCGLQVNCVEAVNGMPRRHVVVRTGYAIECEGNDVNVDQDVELDILDMLGTSPPSYRVPDGDYSLILDSKVPGRFRLAPYVPTPWNAAGLLPGTLIWEFFQNCLKNLGDFYRSQFVASANDASLPVGPAQKRITALLNVLIQIINPTNGSFVFLSGDQTHPNPEQEHSILLALYEATREELKSKTYCAMFDAAKQFPAYPYSGTGIATLFGTGFGKGFRTRLRVDPTGNRGYTLGVDSTIQLFDLNNQRMDSVLNFPGGGVVLDVAFSTDGSQLYAVSNLNNQDTILAIADVNGLQHTWRQPTTVICNIIITTLATRPTAPNSLYALGVGQGIYEINLQSISATPTLKFPIPNAFSHLVIYNDLAYATAGTPGTSFNAVVRMDLNSTSVPPIGASATYALPDRFGTADDDILVAASGQPGVADQLYVIGAVGASSNKQLLIYPATDSNNPAPTAIVDLGENTTVRLAFNPVTKYLMLTMEDSYRIALFRSGSLDTNRYPVQVQPLGIVFATMGNKNQVYTLNYLSNTLSAIPAQLLDPGAKLDMTELVNYRTAIIEAFVDLLGHFLQYLKDCFCDQLLINCPTCDQGQELALASVTVKGNQVFKVCNFSKRKYVKSFPSVDYWMSLLPIAPLLSKAVETFCCAALPDLFSSYKPPYAAATAAVNTTSGFQDRMPAKTARSTIGTWQQTDFKKVLTTPAQKLPLATSMYQDYSLRKIQPPPPPAAAPAQFSDLAGKSVNEAAAKLSASSVQVDHVALYDPAQLQANMRAISSAPDTLPAGTSVTLVADSKGIVRYYIPNPPAISSLRTDLATTQKTLADQQTAFASALSVQDQVATLRDQLVTLQANQAQELAIRDQRIADLSTTTNNLQQQAKAMADMKLQMQTMANTLKTIRPS